jgi:manganese oxidase
MAKRYGTTGTEMDSMTTVTRGMTRRRFVGALGAIGIGGAGIGVYQSTGLSQWTNDDDTTLESNNSHHGDHGNDDEDVIDYEEMDRLHEEGILAFPAETEGRGNQPLEYKFDGDVKVFEITCEKGEWETEPGKIVEAWTYNGTVPGPEIRVTEGDRVRIFVHNDMDESTAIHWHGLKVPIDQDGVPFITQPPIKPGESFTYEFEAKPVGTHIYHSHYNGAEQVARGQIGAFIVEPKDSASRPQFDRDFTCIIHDGPLGFTLNGKGFPATEPYVCKQGERVLLRFINTGAMNHPMHLHGMPFQVIAKDGYLLPQPYYCDNLDVAPGDRWEAVIDAEELGTWVMHCHILSHAENKHGMFGMVTAVIVEE